MIQVPHPEESIDQIVITEKSTITYLECSTEAFHNLFDSEPFSRQIQIPGFAD